MAVPIPNPPTGAPDQFNPGGATTPVPDAATQISNMDQGAAPAPEAPAPSGAALPTDVQNAPTPQPPAPPKIGLKEAFVRGAQEQGNPQYRATGTGEIETAEPARTWTKGGILSAILGGAITAAAQAAQAQTPKGGTGFSAGAAQAEKSRLAADERARKIAQQNFENKQAATNDYARRQYDLAMTMHILQNNEFERDLHPGVKLAQNLENEKSEMLIREAHLQMNKDQLALVSQLGEMGIPYSTFRSIDDPAFQAQAPALRSGDVIMVPSGGRGDDNAAVTFSRADASRPLPVPFKYSLYDKGVDANGAPIPDQRVIQPGAINPTTKKPYTAVDAYDAYIEGQHQLYQLQQRYHMEMSQAQLKNAQEQPAATEAKTALAGAQAGEARAAAAKDIAQAKLAESQTMPGNPNLTGEAYLKSLPPIQQSLVKDIATGHIAMNRLDYIATRNPGLLAAVAQYDPSFDVTGYLKTFLDFTSGKSADALLAGSTALKHLKELNDLNTTESTIFGTPDHTRYQNKLNTVASELVHFYHMNGTNESVGSIKSGLGALTTWNRKAAIQTQAGSMADRLEGYRQRWDEAAPSRAYEARMPTIDNDAKNALVALAPDFVASHPIWGPQKQQVQLPPQALSQLREGQNTTFANGQIWTLQNGNPVRVK